MTPLLSIGMYEITYPDKNVKQVKNLVSHDSYNSIYKPLKYCIEEMELKKEKQKASALKKILHELFGEHFFTENGPYFAAITTGILALPPTQGGNHLCIMIKI